MTAPRYLIAKYISDLQRMEPRNIGIVVWSPHGVEARFAAEKTDRPGEIDGRAIPSFVTSASAYRQWVQFWRDELKKTAAESPGSGKKAPKDSPEFLGALQSWNRGNFVLAEGGFLLDPVDVDELPALADHLYTMLVEGSAGDDQRDPTLDEVCDRLIAETQLATNPNFHTRYEVVCAISPDTSEKFEFSHAYVNGSLQRLYQRVPFSKRERLLRKTVHDSAWMLEKVIGASVISRDRCGALVYASDEQQAEPGIEEAIRVLGSVTRVLNVHDYEKVKAEFAAI